jgi:curved DNA-binding protein CbpA
MYKAADYYRILGVDPRAERATIHRAYRDLARQFHPDVIGDDATMKLVNVAWDVLRDAPRRATYDQERVPAPTTISAPATMAVPRHAGPPPGKPSGSVLTYGRYEGWSLGQIAVADLTYLEWLRKAPGYRWLQAEIDAILGRSEPPPPVPGRLRPRGGFARFASALRG